MTDEQKAMERFLANYTEYQQLRKKCNEIIEDKTKKAREIAATIISYLRLIGKYSWEENERITYQDEIFIIHYFPVDSLGGEVIVLSKGYKLLLQFRHTHHSGGPLYDIKAFHNGDWTKYVEELAGKGEILVKEKMKEKEVEWLSNWSDL